MTDDDGADEYDDIDERITPFQLLHAYSQGMFPMAMSRDDDELFWFSPEVRGVIPLGDDFNIPRSLRKLVKQQRYTVTFDKAFSDVITHCAHSRDDSWINDEIIALFNELHTMGHAHSVECWDAQQLLAGGLYGIALNSAFFGESMFSLQSGASKIALVHLVYHLRKQGFTLLDAQYVNDHLRQFGIQEVPRDEYLTRLRAALNISVSF